MNTTEFSKLTTDDSIYLFELQHDAGIFYFCGVKNVTYKGQAYTPILCEITGLETNISTSQNEPLLSILDNGTIGLLVSSYDNLLGKSIKVRKVRKSLINSTNFFYDVTPENYIISQKTSEIPGKTITFKLKHLGNLRGKIPSRVIYNTCSWKRYRGAGCDYVGVEMYDIANNRTYDPREDVCALTLDACRIRNNQNNFSGVPTINDL